MKYSPELDGLRGIAVLSVILFHARPNGLFSGGLVGVDLFFVLSAYLISAKLAEGQSLKTFYYRRLLRLYPALLLMLAAYVLAAPFVWAGPHFRDAALAALYLSDFTYAADQAPLYLQHTWSLAVEEQFYLVWPFILPLLLKARRPILWLALSYAAMMAWRSGFDWRQFYYRPDTHGTGLILGAMLFFARPKASAMVGYAGLALLASILFAGSMKYAQLCIPAAEIAAACLIVSPPRLLFAKPLIHIGKLSYAMYLWHFPIAYWAREQFDYLPTILIALGGSYAMALLSYHTVEAWARRMKSGDRVEAGLAPAVGVKAG